MNHAFGPGNSIDILHGTGLETAHVSYSNPIQSQRAMRVVTNWERSLMLEGVCVAVIVLTRDFVTHRVSV